jgi:outer membrane protein assembly factor BamA
LLYNSRVVSRIVLSNLLLLIFAGAARPQAPTSTKLNYKLVSVHVKGAVRLDPAGIITASGLKIGQITSDKAFKASAQKLGETGLFTALTYSYQYSPAGCELEFQVAENEKLLPLRFENFVWFSDEDLLGRLRSRVPLFSAGLPESGGLAEEVANTLNAILDENKISGKAEYIRASRNADGPVDSYQYKVNFHPIVIRNVDFPGASEEQLPALESLAKALSGQDYLRTRMDYFAKLDLLPVYHARGYLRASFTEAQPKIAAEGAQTLVDVSFPVSPGKQYQLRAVEWAGNSALPTEKLQSLLKLKAGEPADAVELKRGLEEGEKLYATRGYLFAHITPAPELDDDQSTVRYRLNVTEGDQFRMGELIIDGLDADATKKMAAQWQLKGGDPFDDSYLTRFFQVMYRDTGLRGSWTVVPRQSVSRENKTVSVALHFMRKG